MRITNDIYIANSYNLMHLCLIIFSGTVVGIRQSTRKYCKHFPITLSPNDSLIFCFRFLPLVNAIIRTNCRLVFNNRRSDRTVVCVAQAAAEVPYEARKQSDSARQSTDRGVETARHRRRYARETGPVADRHRQVDGVDDAARDADGGTPQEARGRNTEEKRSV